MLLENNAAKINNSPIYKWGDKIVFGQDGDSSPFQGLGWSEQQDEQSTWTDGPEAHLIFRTVPPPSDILLSFHARPFLPVGAIEYQDVTVYFNFYRVGFFRITQPEDQSMFLPRELFITRVARLTFHIPTCESPQKLRLNEDIRRLGLAFVSVCLQPTS